MAAVGAPAPGSTGAWLLAARPRTLPLAVAPVLVGAATAAAEGGFRPLPAAAALVCALLLQIGANLANDWFDHVRGADGADRVGPPRAMQLGLLTPRAIRTGIALVLGAAAAVGLYLVFEGGWPLAVAGAAALLAAVAYTGGPYPLGYHALGELAVFVFFGLVAVAGTHWVQAGSLSAPALWAALPMGALAAAVLVVNNLRDRAADARVGKRTLAVRLGARGARIEYAALLAVAYLALPALAATSPGGSGALLPLLSLPLAFALLRAVGRHEDAAKLNDALAGTARLALVFGALLGLGIAW